MHYEDFCRQFGSFVPAAEAVGERYYLLGDDLKGFKSGEQRKPYSLGLFLGMGKRQFIPSPALLSLLAAKSKRKAMLKGERSEWLFLCGRDIFPEFYATDVEDGFVLVQNEFDENLGLARIEVDKKQGRILKNIVDRGNYLRHEKIKI